MRRDKSVKDWVVEDAEAGIVVGKVVAGGLVVIVENEASATGDDSLGRLGDGHAVDLVERAVEALDGGEGAHIPNTEHAGDVGGDDLVGAGHPLYSDE